MKGVKYLFSFVFLFSGQFAYAQLAGDYRVNQNVICSDTVNVMVTYDLNLAKDSSFTVSSNGTYIPPYTTFKFECAGT